MYSFNSNSTKVRSHSRFRLFERKKQKRFCITSLSVVNFNYDNNNSRNAIIIKWLIVLSYNDNDLYMHRLINSNAQICPLQNEYISKIVVVYWCSRTHAQAPHGNEIEWAPPDSTHTHSHSDSSPGEIGGRHNVSVVCITQCTCGCTLHMGIKGRHAIIAWCTQQ